jgi:hypothetical protein
VEFIDQSETSPCTQPVPDNQAAVPVFSGFHLVGQTFYWARRAWFQASFQGEPWSNWSAQPVVSDRIEGGTVPTLVVANATPARTVLFRRRLEPLPGQTEDEAPPVENVTLELVAGTINQYRAQNQNQNPTPVYRYVNVVEGIMYDGLPQGRSFYINKDNAQTFVLTLAGSERGIWSVTDLTTRIAQGFATQVDPENRVMGLTFEPVMGTTSFRCFIDPRAGWQGTFRVLPYSSYQQASTCARTGPLPRTCFLPTEMNGPNTLNRLLGFGLILGATFSEPVSGYVGQIGYNPPELTPQTN